MIYPICGGRRNNWASYQEANRPIITIITATFNAANELPWTIRSIKEQIYPLIQWIVADGASIDGTQALLEKNSDIIDYWFSAKDDGIYDAWNKALAYVKGEWVQFLGAGDELYSPDVIMNISSILSKCRPKYDIVYGNLQYIHPKSRCVLEDIRRPWNEIVNKWEMFKPKLPVHPEVFHHSSILQGHNPFDTRYRIASDVHFLLKNILQKPPKHIDYFIDKMPIGGVSWGLVNIKIIKEISKINKALGIRPPMLHLMMEGFKLVCKIVLLTFLPMRWTYKLADCYRAMLGLAKRWNI